MVATAPTWADIYDHFLSLITDKTVVIYNADFDVQIVNQTSKKYDLVSPQIKSVCAMAMYSHFWGEWDYRRDNWHWQKLSDAAKQQGVRVEGNAHRALADCLMTLGVVNAVAANRNSTE
jgi:DNA polymerase-3 subunit epsilon